LTRIAYSIVLLVLTLLFYAFFCPLPHGHALAQTLPWWQPRGEFLHWGPGVPLWEMARSGWPEILIPIGLGVLPLILLAGLGFHWWRSIVIRTWIVAWTITLCLLVTYGILAEGAIWRFFSWRFVATAAGLGGTLSIAILAPQILGAALRRSRGLAACLIGIGFVLAWLLSTEITGTNSSLPAGLSPWPAIPVFGIQLGVWGLGVLHATCGAGTWLAGRTQTDPRPARGILVAAGLGFLFASLGPGGETKPWGFALVAAVWTAGALLARRHDSVTLRALGRTRLWAGLVLATIALITYQGAVAYQRAARDDAAPRLIQALEHYRIDHDTYPEKLQQLVPDYLREIPRARMGLIPNADEGFVFSSFGETYVLEFASVQWVQCAYTPRFSDEEDSASTEEEAEDEADGAQEGGWSCDTTPPRLY